MKYRIVVTDGQTVDVDVTAVPEEIAPVLPPPVEPDPVVVSPPLEPEAKPLPPEGPRVAFDVTQYGAAGDGLTDDWPAILRAVEAAQTQAATRGSAVLFFPPGDYAVSQPIVITVPAITIAGSGAGGDNNVIGTRITPLSDFPADRHVLEIGAIGPSAPLGGMLVRDLRIGGEAPLTNTVHGLLAKCWRSRFNNVIIEGMSGDGLVIRGRTATEGGQWNTYESMFHQCQLRRNGGSGIVMAGACADMHFTDCVSQGNGAHGLHGCGASCHYVSCHFYSNDLNNIFLNGSGSRSKWVGCKCENSGQHNVNIDVSNSGVVDLHFVGCNFSGGGATADNAYDNFVVRRTGGGNSASGVLAACTMQWVDNGHTHKPRYHLNLSGASAKNWRITGCKYDTNFRTAAFNHDANAATCTHNGLGINAGDPRVGGQWAGKGEDGLTVIDPASGALYLFAAGEWRPVGAAVT